MRFLKMIQIFRFSEHMKNMIYDKNKMGFKLLLENNHHI